MLPVRQVKFGNDIGSGEIVTYHRRARDDDGWPAYAGWNALRDVLVELCELEDEAVLAFLNNDRAVVHCLYFRPAVDSENEDDYAKYAQCTAARKRVSQRLALQTLRRRYTDALRANLASARRLPTGTGVVNADEILALRAALQAEIARLGAKDAGILVGWYGVYWRSHTNLNYLCIAPAAQGLGFGTVLVQHFKREARAGVGSGTAFIVSLLKPGTRRVYEKCGFAAAPIAEYAWRREVPDEKRLKHRVTLFAGNLAKDGNAPANMAGETQELEIPYDSILLHHKFTVIDLLDDDDDDDDDDEQQPQEAAEEEKEERRGKRPRGPSSQSSMARHFIDIVEHNAARARAQWFDLGA